MLWSPPSVTTMMNGNPSQMFVIIGAMKAHVVLENHSIGAMWNTFWRMRFTAPYW
jgi:hypothetical protein